MAKILIVDDEPSQVKGLKILLVAKGHTVVTASAVDDAIEVYRSNQDIDLLITDCSMSINSGEAHVPNAGAVLLRELKDLGYCGKSVLVSSVSTCDGEHFTWKRVSKPFDIQVFVGWVHELLTSGESQKEYQEFKRERMA